MADNEQIVQQIESEFRLDEEGKAFVSIRGAARLAGVEHTSIRKALEGGSQK